MESGSTSKLARGRGRASLPLVFSLAAILFAAVLGGLLWFLRRDAAPGPRSAESDAPSALVAPGAAEAPGAVAPPGAPSSVTEAAPAAAPVPAAAAAFRIHGRVIDGSEQPIAGAIVRWLPAAESVLSKHRHDGALFLQEVEAPAAGLREAWPRSRRVEADAAGRFEIELPARESPSVLVAWAPGHAAAIRGLDGVAAAAAAVREASEGAGDDSSDVGSAIEVEVVLGAGGSIAGEVRDADSGAPASGMVVGAGRSREETPSFFGIPRPDRPLAGVGEDGRYLFLGLAPDDYLLAPERGSSDYPSLDPKAGRKVTLEAGAAVTGIDFEVTRGGTLRVVVLGPDGKARRGLEVQVAPAELMARMFTGEGAGVLAGQNLEQQTDGDGRAVFGGLPLGDRYRAACAAKEFAPAFSDAAELTREQPEAEVTLALSSGASIFGFVFDEDGNAADGAAVDILAGSAESDDMLGFLVMSRNAKSSKDGAFALAHLPKGAYRLRARAAESAVNPWELFSRDGDKPVEVALDGVNDVHDVRLVMERSAEPSAGISGLVVDDRGQPVAEATVSAAGGSVFEIVPFAGSPQAQSGADGRFAIDKLKGAGPFKVSAAKPGHAGAALEGIAAGAADLLLTLPRFGTIRGRVFASDGGPPPPGGKVRAVEQGAGGVEDFLKTIEKRVQNQAADPGTEVAADGTFVMRAPLGAFEIEARVPGFAPGRSGPLRVGPGEERAGVEIAISAGAALRGKVTPPRSVEGIAQARVSVVPVTDAEPDEPWAEFLPEMFFDGAIEKFYSDAEGNFEVLHLAPGTYAVSASHPEHAPSDTVTVTLKRDEAAELRPLSLKAGAALAGAITEAGKPLAGLMVQVMGGGPLRQAASGADGRFIFKGLKGGDVMVVVNDVSAMLQGRRMRMKTRAVALEAGVETRVDFVFGVGRRIHGKVEGLKPGPFQQIMLQRPNGPDLEGMNRLDPRQSVELIRYQAGMGFIGQDGVYEIADVEPGEYVLIIPFVPDNPADIAAYSKAERQVLHRENVRIEDKDLERNIKVEPASR